MSTCHWICEGIGIKTNKLYPYLNKAKCISLLKREIGKDFEIPDDEDFEIDNYFYGEPFQHLGDLLCHCDNTNTMTFGDNNDGDYYFYYIPSYPWERQPNEPLSILEVHERIIDAVQCICDLSRSEIEALIDDNIYDYGCG